ncbi:MAG: hypothetical protein J5617_00030 [Bacilli bacterium]|nr:hypothetical protein [Bacilli bacterium]
MMVEFARNRIAKIRADYSHTSLLSKLGLIKNKEKENTNDFASWTDQR